MTEINYKTIRQDNLDRLATEKILLHNIPDIEPIICELKPARDIAYRTLCLSLVSLYAGGSPYEYIQPEIERYDLNHFLTSDEKEILDKQIPENLQSAEYHKVTAYSYQCFGAFQLMWLMGLATTIPPHDDDGLLFEKLFSFDTVDEIVLNIKFRSKQEIIKEKDYFQLYKSAYLHEMETHPDKEYGYWIGTMAPETVWARLEALERALNTAIYPTTELF
jgi:Domain of unknown function (DUF4272)